MILRRFRRVGVVVAPVMMTTLLAGCVNHNQIAMEVGAPPKDAAQLREMQTARFDAADEVVLLTEATQVLQDLGFGVAESAPQVGVLTGSKSRDATEAGEVAAQIALTVVAAAFLVAYVPTWDTNQVIRVTLVSQPVPQSRQTQLRASFERLVANNKGQIRVEPLQQPEMHQEFFKMLRNGMAMRENRT
ncbi:hypothetical protein [Roseomonas populi]|uniref:Lipoprotein n=1 Tax=Roseomonas populi TaxID=3121582 RepID=A0ABT1X2D2_9PROT|nr:hypothetical protein [Roseomonas pecuniae]MCR0982253.1 hypothetical protein [Roseomonas pecuniae]